jgi:beta-xylosidase
VVVGTTYWAYATGSAGLNLQVMSSNDLLHWSAPTDPLPTLPTWATTGHTWAPGVAKAGGTFVMWYTVRDTASGRQCISVATSSVPQGPYIDQSSGPAICQLSDGGSIDPTPLVDGTGRRYLYWKSDDNAIGRATKLWGQRLTTRATSLLGTPSVLLTEDANWQAPSVEGPAVVVHDGTYFLFYGANNYASSRSGIGYATGSSALAPFVDQSITGRWLSTRGNATGPQGPAVFMDRTGARRLAFAAWYGTVGYPAGRRALWIATLSFRPDGRPAVS